MARTVKVDVEVKSKLVRPWLYKFYRLLVVLCIPFDAESAIKKCYSIKTKVVGWRHE